jgi:hypothetical protein
MDLLGFYFTSRVSSVSSIVKDHLRLELQLTSKPVDPTFNTRLNYIYKPFTLEREIEDNTVPVSLMGRNCLRSLSDRAPPD